MKKILFLLIAVLPLAVMAEGQNKENLLEKTFRLGKDYLDQKAARHIDSNYIEVPQFGFIVNLSSSYAGIKAEATIPDLPVYGTCDGTIRSNLSNQVGFAIGYRSLRVKYSVDVTGGYSNDFSVASNGNVWGLQYRRHSTEGIHGNLNSRTLNETTKISKKDGKIRTTIMNAYYVMNYRHFSLPAISTFKHIQKRSAGSPLFYLTYLNSRVTIQNEQLRTKLNKLKKMESYQVAAGFGYGYNLVLCKTKLLLHASAIPTAVVLNKNFLTADYTTTLSDGSTYSTEVSKELKPKHQISFSGIGRLAGSYRFNDRMLAGFNGIMWFPDLG